MPPTTSIQTFIDALRSKRTKITQHLDTVVAGRMRSLTPAERSALEAPNALEGPVDSWPLGDEFADGLTNPEIAHINHWPPPQRERVREALVRALEQDREVRFLWELNDGMRPTTEIRELGDLPIMITFRTPRALVSVADSASGDVTALVGEEEQPLA